MSLEVRKAYLESTGKEARIQPQKVVRDVHISLEVAEQQLEELERVGGPQALEAIQEVEKHIKAALHILDTEVASAVAPSLVDKIRSWIS
jgi:hypothetical protein